LIKGKENMNVKQKNMLRCHKTVEARFIPKEYCPGYVALASSTCQEEQRQHVTTSHPIVHRSFTNSVLIDLQAATNAVRLAQNARSHTAPTAA